MSNPIGPACREPINKSTNKRINKSTNQQINKSKTLEASSTYLFYFWRLMAACILYQIRSIPNYLAFVRGVMVQQRFIRNRLNPDLMRFSETNDGTLSQQDMQKISRYYGLGVPAILGEMFCLLRGSPMTETERVAATYLGAITGIFDDFFDSWRIPPERINQFIHKPETIVPANSNEKLFLEFYVNKDLANIPDRLKFLEASQRVFEAQIESGKQTGNQHIDQSEIEEITFRKGGVSLIFYRMAFGNHLSDAEHDALYSAGALLQLGNDIFDVYKDLQAGVRTLPTTMQSIHELRMVFEKRTRSTFDLFEALPYPKRNIRNALNILQVGVSRCYVCLHQLEQLQKKTHGKFIPTAYTRKELICDMEKPVNLLRSVKYHLIICP